MGKKIVVFSKKEDIIADKYIWFKETIKAGVRLRIRRPTTEVASLFTFFPHQCSSYWFWSSDFSNLIEDKELRNYLSDLPLDKFYVFEPDKKNNYMAQLEHIVGMDGEVILLIDFNKIERERVKLLIDNLRLLSYNIITVRFKNLPYDITQEIDNFIYFNNLLMQYSKDEVDLGICKEVNYKLAIEPKPVIDVSRLSQRLIDKRDPYGDCLCHLHEDIMGFGNVFKDNIRESDIKKGYVTADGEIDFEKIDEVFKQDKVREREKEKKEITIKNVTMDELHLAATKLAQGLEKETRI